MIGPQRRLLHHPLDFGRCLVRQHSQFHTLGEEYLWIITSFSSSCREVLHARSTLLQVVYVLHLLFPCCVGFYVCMRFCGNIPAIFYLLKKEKKFIVALEHTICSELLRGLVIGSRILLLLDGMLLLHHWCKIGRMFDGMG